MPFTKSSVSLIHLSSSLDNPHRLNPSLQSPFLPSLSSSSNTSFFNEYLPYSLNKSHSDMLKQKLSILVFKERKALSALSVLCIQCVAFCFLLVFFLQVNSHYQEKKLPSPQAQHPRFIWKHKAQSVRGALGLWNLNPSIQGKAGGQSSQPMGQLPQMGFHSLPRSQFYFAVAFTIAKLF